MQKMNTCAVICEFNPLHLGHKYLSDKLSEKYDCKVAVMSANYVQRGEPAIFNKYDRAEDAVKNGFDLVLELPFPWCISGAEYFAKAGVNIISKLGINRISFGSECADADLLQKTAEHLMSSEYTDALNEAIKKSKNSPKSALITASEVYKKIYGADMPDTANDILSIEYIKAIKRGGYNIDFDIVKRANGFSATDSRMGILKNDRNILYDNVGKELADIYKGRKAMNTDDFGPIILSTLAMKTRDEISLCADLGGGIAGLLYSCLPKAVSANELISLCSTKKYTKARIRRAIFSAVFGITKEQIESEPLYTCVLAANKKGCDFLHSIKKTSDIEILTKPADMVCLSEGAAVQYKQSLKADQIWESVYGCGIGAAQRHTAYIEHT